MTGILGDSEEFAWLRHEVLQPSDRLGWLGGGFAWKGGGARCCCLIIGGVFRLLVQGEFIYKTVDYFIEGSICA
jgi:hypothetical protein